MIKFGINSSYIFWSIYEWSHPVGPSCRVRSIHEWPGEVPRHDWPVFLSNLKAYHGLEHKGKSNLHGLGMYFYIGTYRMEERTLQEAVLTVYIEART